jgi:hypothetical protein
MPTKPKPQLPSEQPAILATREAFAKACQAFEGKHLNIETANVEG